MRTANAEDARAYDFDLSEPVTLTIRTASLSGDLRIRLLDENRIVIAENDDFGGLGTMLLEEVAMRDGARWFMFDLPEDGLVLTEAIGNGADPVVTLFDRAGASWARTTAAQTASTACSSRGCPPGVTPSPYG